MLLYLLLACNNSKFITDTGFCEQQISVTDLANNLTDEQKEVSYIIEKQFDEMEIPDNITAAAIVNAYAESGLDSKTIGDGGDSVGVFQLNINGLGHKLTDDMKSNLYTNSNIVGIQVLKNHNLIEADENNQDIPLLTAIFTKEIMRPKNKDEKAEYRMKLAERIFPERI
jgi:hypothetical protein